MIAHIRASFAKSKPLFVSILLLGLTATIFAIGLMFVAGYLISASADNVYSLLMLNIPLAFVEIFGLGKPIARYYERLKSHDFVLRLTSNLRHQLFSAIQKRYDENNAILTGEALGLLSNDIEQVQNLYLRTVFPVLVSCLTGVLLVIVLGGMSFPLGIFALGMCVLLCVIMPALVLALQKSKISDVSEARSELYSSVTDSVLGAQDVAISGLGQQRAQGFLARFELLKKNESALKARNRTVLLCVQVIMLIILLVLIWWATGRFGGVPGGRADWIVAIALGFFPVIEVFAPLSQEFEDGFSYNKSLNRLVDSGGVNNTETECTDEAAVTEALSNKATPETTLQPPYSIELCHLSFMYEQDSIQNHDVVYPHASAAAQPALPNTRINTLMQSRCILSDLSLTIPYGQKVAVLGKSGSGKTTLASLIHGDFIPTEGSVSIAGVSAVSLRDEMWRYVGFISQSSYLFAMSILDNLRIGKMEVTLAEAWRALEMVGLKTYVEQLPDGLETMADEAGLRFSGGQRQRLVLARVLLQNPPIVILDEPTVGLDPRTETVVLDTIQQVCVDKTVIMITHHLQGVEQFDRVLFIEQGKLVMDDAPNKLLKTNERYRKLLSFDKGFAS